MRSRVDASPKGNEGASCFQTESPRQPPRCGSAPRAPKNMMYLMSSVSSTGVSTVVRLCRCSTVINIWLALERARALGSQIGPHRTDVERGSGAAFGQMCDAGSPPAQLQSCNVSHVMPLTSDTQAGRRVRGCAYNRPSYQIPPQRRPCKKKINKRTQVKTKRSFLSTHPSRIAAGVSNPGSGRSPPHGAAPQAPRRRVFLLMKPTSRPINHSPRLLQDVRVSELQVALEQ